MDAATNELLTQIGPGAPMGAVLRRHWTPIAGISEFDEVTRIKPIRLMGEDLVLYRDLSGQFGLVQRACAHRRADLSYGFVEKCGLRCNYHGWAYNEAGQCVEMPYEDTVAAKAKYKNKVRITAYPIKEHAGMLWTYMGPLPAPELPNWEPFTWANGFTQIIISEIPCNWLQCQENSIDPVHFEWMHENWGARLRHGDDVPYGPKHLKLAFEEFEHGLIYKRVREDTDEQHPYWTIGRTALWPNAFYLGEHFEWRVPIDDENTLHVLWKFSHVPKEREPYVQQRIPTWHGPTHDANGQWITSHVVNQDFLAWCGQGRIADRTKELLGASDRGVVMLRKHYFQELQRLAAGEEPRGVIRDPERNVRVALPSATPHTSFANATIADLLADPIRRVRLTTFMLQAGQPDWVRREFEEAMGVPQEDFTGLPVGRSAS